MSPPVPRGPPWDAEKMCAATPMLAVSCGVAPGPIVAQSQSGKLHLNPLRAAIISFVLGEKSDRVLFNNS